MPTPSPTGCCERRRLSRGSNRKEALELLRAFKAGDPAVNERHIWVLIVFSLWHQIYVERAYDPIALGSERAQGAAR